MTLKNDRDRTFKNSGSRLVTRACVFKDSTNCASRGCLMDISMASNSHKAQVSEWIVQVICLPQCTTHTKAKQVYTMLLTLHANTKETTTLHANTLALFKSRGFQLGNPL